MEYKDIPDQINELQELHRRQEAEMRQKLAAHKEQRKMQYIIGGMILNNFPWLRNVPQNELEAYLSGLAINDGPKG